MKPWVFRHFYQEDGSPKPEMLPCKQYRKERFTHQEVQA
jgi:hypothetical protein